MNTDKQTTKEQRLEQLLQRSVGFLAKFAVFGALEIGETGYPEWREDLAVVVNKDVLKRCEDLLREIIEECPRFGKIGIDGKVHD